MTELLNVTGLSVEYARRGRLGRRNVDFKAVDDVSFRVDAGETVGLVGESGSGKSTIGRAVLGLVRPSAGQISFAGTEITFLRGRQRRDLASDLQVVFQDPFSSLNPSLTIGESLAEPLRVHKGISRDEATRLVRESLDSVGLPVDSAGRYPSEFSGGQRQRVAIARALSVKPQLIVCDEAVSALDRSTQAQVVNLLSDLRKQTGVAYLFISHDLAVVRHLSRDVIVLYRGRVMESGPTLDVSDNPLHPYTRALLAAAPISNPALQRERRTQRALLSSGTTVNALPTPPSACPFAPRCPHAEPVCWSARPIISSVHESQVACHMYNPSSGHSKAGAFVATPARSEP
jgi:oligopeptide/dipeptide ABC transporter ATP-binding protein